MKKINWRSLMFIAIIALAGLLLPFVRTILGFLVDYQWFVSEGFGGVWVTRWFTTWGLQLAVGLFAFLFIWGNLQLTKKVVNQALQVAKSGLTDEPRLFSLADWFKPRYLGPIYLLISLGLAFLITQAVGAQWEKVLLALHPESFGVKDPLYALDVGFFIFQLPFLELLYTITQTVFVLTAVILFIVYQTTNSLGFGKVGWGELPRARFHFAGIGALFFLGKALGYRLDIYNLVFSSRGVAFGGSYTDVHAQLPAYQILTVLAVITAIVLVFSLIRKRIRLALIGVGVLVGASILIGQVYPLALQRFQVEPNEIVMEKPYIDLNIYYTRLGFGLENIQDAPFTVKTDLQAADLAANTATINNIRLWDWRPLQQTYGQLQEIRLYYKFKGIDIDRYIIDGQPRQVMLAARELDPTALATTAQTWVNQRLLYTHGYGVAMSPVNEVTSEGLPKFFLKDIPPKAASPSIIATRPEIYFGEGSNDYVIVKTAAKEFDYPAGEENVYTQYEGDAGVPIGSFWQKILFAAYFGDLKILLSSDLLPNSHILMERNIVNRLTRVASFLTFDSDPYLVVHDGRLTWMADAYTTSKRYPYSEPVQGVGNYIRNAIKATVDAYTGEMHFYIADATDPIVQSYSRIFPGMFEPLDNMPPNLRTHVRYPEDLFKIQAQTFATYHMEDAGVFYNKEDEWTIPKFTVAGNQQPMEPYYTLMKLPGKTEAEFILMMPFTPAKKDNMIAWMAARADGENYGHLLVYAFPKQELIYGPAQIEARIDQDSDISAKLTLWNQKGSSVIRGNLLVLPINNSLLYIEPLFLQSAEGKLPALRRVIVVYGERVVMEETLDIALEKIFGLPKAHAAVPGEPPPTTTTPVPASIAELTVKAKEAYANAIECQKAGDWSGYGAKLQELESLLSNLEQTAQR
ncbi:MAG: UPF0182 family protein [Heliobacteriaceae bacterium]|nr:UPF0182 family protein [Heliobacteriaceae bacterium]